MKLFEVPNHTYIYFLGTKYFFHHIDGMFSYCESSDGHIVNLNANCEVELSLESKWDRQCVACGADGFTLGEPVRRFNEKTKK